MIPDEVIEQVRDSADLVAIIGESVTLKRTGSDYRGPCPFHGGTHRNFAVIPKKGLFYCYVCHAGGDVFSYLMKRFGMDYPTAIRDVARRVGMVIPESAGPAAPDPREPLFSALTVAQEWYTGQLIESADGKDARRYLERRELPLDTLAPYGLGYAPRGNAFVRAMTELGIAESVLIEAGLLVRREDGRIVARFRDRLLFPIADARGRVVGFGGRILGRGEPKYLNSPDTDVFHKGRLLYNLHFAKNAIRKADEVLLVEGYFDVLRLVLAGIEHVVAPLGTALTTDQATILKRYAPKAILLYDSDSPGLRATFRAADELLRHKMRVHVATLPTGHDPDSLVQAGGKDALENVLTDATDVLERKIQLLERKGWFEDVAHRRAAIDRLLPTLRATADPIERELYLTRVAEKSGISKDVLAQEVARAPAIGTPPRSETVSAERRTPQAAGRRDGESAERALLRVILHDPSWLERARQEVRPEWFEGPALRELFERVSGVGGERGQGEPPPGVSEGAARLWAELKALEPELAQQDVDDLFVRSCQVLESRPLFREFERLASQIRSAPEEKKGTLLAQHQARKQELEERFPGEWRRRHFRRTVSRRRSTP
jgi:DNA primase